MAKKSKSKHIVFKEDGTFYYNYYQKKRGRKKKRGPKKKKVKNREPYDGTWYFKIVRCNFKKQVEYIGHYRTLEDVESVKQQLIKENESVEFPVKYVNNQRIKRQIVDYDGEYVVLKRYFPEKEENSESKLRNQYGKMVTLATNSSRFRVYDRFQCVREETFWAYRYSPKTDRKTYRWISDNFVTAELGGENLMINIYCYNNKVLFRYEDKRINMVICKNTSDAIRMYNKLSDEFKKDKTVLFTGMVNGAGNERCMETVKLIAQLTGWPLYKIHQSTTLK